MQAKFIVFAWFAAVAAATAKDRLVSSTGEFDGALEAIEPGDAIVFKDGTWPDVKLHFHAQGREGKPVTLRAETPGKVVLTGSSQLIIDGSHLVVSGFKFQKNSNLTTVVTPHNVAVAAVVIFTTNTSDSRLTETAILDSGTNVSTCVHLRPGGQSNRVDHCFFSNQGAIGVTFYVEAHPTRPNYHQVDHNYFGDRKPGTGNRWETIRIGHSEQQEFVSGTTVEQNYFFRCNGENEMISNKSGGNRYLHNSFVENRGQLCLRHGDHAWVEGNYFFAGNEPAAQGVRMSGSEHVIINNYFKGLGDALIVYNGQDRPEVRGYLPVNNTLIAFNTFDNCAQTLALGVGGTGRSLAPKNLRLAYNLARVKSGKIIESRAPGIDVKYEGNVMFGTGLGIPATPGISTNTPALSTDEWGRIFPDASVGSVRVKPGDFAQAGNDMNGEARAGDTNPGAIGVHSARPLYPLSPKETGPGWMTGR